MGAFFFGTASRPLFGVFDPPAIRLENPVGVVICQPLGGEYLRSHRFHRNLSATLAGAGFSVLRFDYTGTGDSGGGNLDVTLSGMVRDLEVAIAELQQIANVSQVLLLGVRLGAVPAVSVTRDRRSVAGLVLLDPITRHDGVSANWKDAGFHVSPELEQEVGCLDLEPLIRSLRDQGRVQCLLTSNRTADPSADPLADSSADLSDAANGGDLRGTMDWEGVGGGAVVMAPGVLRDVVTMIEEVYLEVFE